jgi:hypothetical protein
MKAQPFFARASTFYVWVEVIGAAKDMLTAKNLKRVVPRVRHQIPFSPVFDPTNLTKSST